MTGAKDPRSGSDSDEQRKLPAESASAAPCQGPRFLHVVEQGAWLRRVGSRLRVQKGEEIKLDVPAFKLQGVLVYGNVQVSTPALRLLQKESIWLAFFTRNGKYAGRFQPPEERAGAIRLRQRERALDPDACLRLSKALVLAKVRGQHQSAAAYAKNYPVHSLKRAYQALKSAPAAIANAGDLPTLRGVEGSAARAYFELFRAWNRSAFPFEARHKHPAPDPMNALLSFGYTLLTGELEGLIEGAGLDPTIGMYHAPDVGRPSLACDWIEEFRHVTVDRLVLRLVNLGTLRPEHFLPVDGRRGVRLTEDGLRRFLIAWEQMMTGGGNEDPSATSISWRSVLIRQLGPFFDAVTEGATYMPHPVA